MTENRYEFILENLGCANCAAKIEDRVQRIKGVKEATLNFSTKRLIFFLEDEVHYRRVAQEARAIIKKLEPQVVVRYIDTQIKIDNIEATRSYVHSHSQAEEHEHCNCDTLGHSHGHSHEHHHGENRSMDSCSSCETRSQGFIAFGEQAASLDPEEENRKAPEASHSHDHSHGHSHAHSHSHATSEEGDESELKQQIIQFTAATILFTAATMFNFSERTELLLFFFSYLLAGGEVVIRAFRNIIRGEVFDENFLMTIATIGAFAIGESPEAAAVMLFYQIGELFQDMAVNRSRKSIADLMDIRPDHANLLINGVEKAVSPEVVKVGDTIIVKPGEKIPLDGIVLKGSSMVDTSALTGESVPREVDKDSEVLGGFINKNALLEIKVTKTFGESTVSKILDLVQNAGNRKAPTEKFITKFARYYTPAVVIAAAALAVIPPVILPGATFSQWLYRALIFLVISCPCALVVSIPLGFFGGIGGASKNGILIKGSNFLEALNSVETVVFDKTGTLTKGVFEVSRIVPEGRYSKEELLEYAALVESYSSHPIATSIINAYQKEVDKSRVKGYEEISGYGTKALIDGKEVMAGNAKLMRINNIGYVTSTLPGTTVYLAIDKKFAGFIVISDEIKEDSKQAIKELKSLGIKNTVMLTGDISSVAESIGEEIGLDQVYSELLPQHKVEKLEELDKKKSPKSKLVFVGDGINDAPVLARADIGIAMGGLGSDAAIEAADIVIMNDEPSKIASAIRIASNTRKIVWQNIIFAMVVKVIVMILGAFGKASMWSAVFADVGVALIAVLNAMRVLTYKADK